MSRIVLALVAGLGSGCAGGGAPDSAAGPAPPVTEAPPPADWCAVESLFRRRCTLCHSPGNLQGELDLVTDAYAALVGVESAAFGAVLVVPGDPDGSLLVRKMAGTQGPAEGEAMPPPAGDADDAEVVARWIADGASPDCERR